MPGGPHWGGGTDVIQLFFAFLGFFCVCFSQCRRCGWPIWLTSVTPIPAADDQAMVAVPLEEASVCSLFQHTFFGDFNPCSFATCFGALTLFFFLFLRECKYNLLRMNFYLLPVVWGSKLSWTVTTSFSMEIKNGRLANTKGRYFHHTLLSHHTTCHQWIASWHMPKHLLKTHLKTLYLSNVVVHYLEWAQYRNWQWQAHNKPLFR